MIFSCRRFRRESTRSQFASTTSLKMSRAPRPLSEFPPAEIERLPRPLDLRFSLYRNGHSLVGHGFKPCRKKRRRNPALAAVLLKCELPHAFFTQFPYLPQPESR